MEELLDKIKALPVTYKAENTWIDKKYKPVTIRLVELDKVTGAINSVKQLAVTNRIKEFIIDLENLSNGYTALNVDKVGTAYVIYKSDLDLFIQELKNQF